MEEAEKLLLEGLQKSIDGVATSQEGMNKKLTKHTGLLSEVSTKVKYQNGEVERCKKDRGDLFSRTGKNESDIKSIKTRHELEEKYENKTDKIKQGYQNRNDVKINRFRLYMLCIFGGISLLASIIFGVVQIFL